MQITRDDWAPLFKDLRDKLSASKRRLLLSQMIGEIQDITQQNFGPSGIDRPKPWSPLSPQYASEWKDGDTTPTLMMSDEKHELRNPLLPHLIDCFDAKVNENKAELTNRSPYADGPQLGYGQPERPYYPVIGDELTPYAESRMKEIVDGHFRT